MTAPPAKRALVFFRTATGKEPVREWLLTLSQEDRLQVGYDLMRTQWRWPVGMPLCRSLGDGLWETRSTLAGNRIARVVFTSHRGVLVALTGFIKKTQTTPTAELELARRRKKELLHDE
ncbi:type II toxin-antitoxin system RelE/ParE family toxin [Pigmentiphaga litoralis]|uniref:type II toxin-antitoxin system RelE/ParE family toxin n=1 Tax=Pigmentiphaga litoralis TaxID=516702 RepID=UPI003B4315C9